MRPAFKCNGMTLRRQSRPARLRARDELRSWRERRDGSREILAYHFEGEVAEQPERRLRPLRRVDLLLRPVVRAHARLRASSASGELGWQGVFRIPPGGGPEDLELVVDKDEFEQPNGICFSPDESLLYINDTPRAYIKVYDVAPDGSISNGRMFFEGIGSGVIEEGIPDGMKCDERGNIWVTGPGGIWVISPAGEHLGVIKVPENTGQPDLGRRGLAHALHPELDLAVHDPHDRRPAPRAVHGLGGRR